jgi:hypothetical protein
MSDPLEHILINTYNADQTQRLQAEQALSQYLSKPGSLYHLIIFLGNPEIHRDLRLVLLRLLQLLPVTLPLPLPPLVLLLPLPSYH